MNLYIAYPRLHEICSIHEIKKDRVDKWVSAIKYDRDCIEHGFDFSEMIQVGIHRVLTRLEHYSGAWSKMLDIDYYFNDVDNDVFNKSYDYQHGYFAYLVGWRYGTVLRAMVMSEKLSIGGGHERIET